MTAATLPTPLLPLVLYRTPPGLEQILAQEGVPFRRADDLRATPLPIGRFVLYDGQTTVRRDVQARLYPGQVALDIDPARKAWPTDPFAAALETRPAVGLWDVAGASLRERVARAPKGQIRRAVADALRVRVERAGGVWARLAPVPAPYRSAFGFRVDLDEPVEDDYFRFAAAREPIDDCTTHFVSTAAYGDNSRVMGDLAGRDVQSHGHVHVVYRDARANRRNLERADRILRRWGVAPEGFVAPEGRWNPGLDDAIAGLGYRYSSEFQVGFDDLPFFAWRGDRASRVLQVPVHPVCEGSFLDAGVTDIDAMARYFVSVLERKWDAGEAVFLYGHPERRLGRFPELLTAIARAVDGRGLVWRVGMTAFARWWRWRLSRRWSLFARGAGAVEILFDDWDHTYTPALELQVGEHVATVTVQNPRTLLRREELVFHRRPVRADDPPPRLVSPGWRPRDWIKAALDWETVTPLDELPADGLRRFLKRRLRRWRAGRTPHSHRSVSGVVRR